MHEILTVQLGSQANYVGAHFWNTQESYFTYGSEEPSPVDHNVHFRAGIAPNGAETFTPRTLIYDLKDGFGALRKREGEYEESFDDRSSLWNTTTTPIRTAPTILQHPYITSLSSTTAAPTQTPLLTNPIRSFTDYSHTFFHPRSLLPISLSSLPTPSSLHPLQSHAAGEELFDALDRGQGDATGEGDLFERDLRWWAEECDSLQGVMVLAGAEDAWGGFAGRWCERWRDEMGSKGCWVWGLEGTRRGDETRSQLQQKLLNSTLALARIAEHASLYIPLSSSSSSATLMPLPFNSPWHTSALQSLIIEATLLPSRLHRADASAASLSEIEEVVTGGAAGRKVVACGISAKDAEDGNERMVNGSGGAGDARMTNGFNGHMTNGHGIYHDDDDEEGALDVDFFANSLLTTLSGPGSERGRREDSTMHSRHTFGRAEVLRGAWDVETSVEEGDDRRLGDGEAPRVRRFTSTLTHPQQTSFPALFNSVPHGRQLAVRTALSTSTMVARQLSKTEGIVRRWIGIEEREALGHGLRNLAEEYEWGWEGSEEESGEE